MQNSCKVTEIHHTKTQQSYAPVVLLVGEDGHEHDGDVGHELDLDVDRGAGSVLERVADSVSL